jgi:transketolase
MASGSEVQLAVEAEKQLAEKGLHARIISVPCMELFEKQSDTYKTALIPKHVTARVAIEAGIDMGWHKYLGSHGKFVGMSSYGASAPGATCFEKFGFTAENVVANVMDALSND